MFRGELGRHPFDRRLRAERFLRSDARELELHGEGVGEVLEVAFGNTGASAGPLADLDDAGR